MSNILDDLIDVTIDETKKPKINKLHKFIFGLIIFVIVSAFIIGEYKIIISQRFNTIENNIIKNEKEIKDVKYDVDNKLREMNSKIDNVDNRVDQIILHQK